MNAHTEQPPLAVVAHFARFVGALKWHSAAPGFSGAVVWRGEDGTGAPRVALKGWPVGIGVERVEQVHLWMSRAAHLPFVPKAFAPLNGRSAVFADGRVWDACQWMPGAPIAAPSAEAVRTACEAVARLHQCWPSERERHPCRGVAARFDILTNHRALIDSWNRSQPPVVPELDPLLRRAAGEVARLADAAILALRPWAARPLLQQPCVRDLRGEHVFFDGNRVTGVIDYGAMAVDHPAIDLARLLGDYAAADESLFAVGVSAYRDAGALLDVPDAFVTLLARTGTVGSLLGWLVRIFVRREPVLYPSATLIRLEELLLRVERIFHFEPR